MLAFVSEKKNTYHGTNCSNCLQVFPLFEKAESKNKLLRSVAGGGVDQIGQLQARWDKFELMMESHELMVKEQVSECKITDTLGIAGIDVGGLCTAKILA